MVIWVGVIIHVEQITAVTIMGAKFRLLELNQCRLMQIDEIQSSAKNGLIPNQNQCILL